MTWSYGSISLNGTLIETSWKSIGGAVVAVDVPLGTGLDAAITIDDNPYVIANLSRETYPDRATVPLITRAEMDARIAAAEEAKAKARADFEGKPWPPVASTAKTAGADGE